MSVTMGRSSSLDQAIRALREALGSEFVLEEPH